MVAVADPFDDIAEGDESNNIAVIPLAITSARVFVSSTNLSPTFGGALEADVLCQSDANSAGLGGQFRAWISDTTTSPNARFVQHSAPYVRTDGQTVADDYAGLTSGTLQNPINLDAMANSASECIWTSTNTAGDALSPECDDWSNVNSGATIGSSDAVDVSWTQQIETECMSSCRLYCVEQ